MVSVSADTATEYLSAFWFWCTPSPIHCGRHISIIPYDDTLNELQSQLCGLATWHGRCSRISSDSDLSSSGECDGGGSGQLFPAGAIAGDGDDRRAVGTMASSEDALADAVAILLIN